MVFLVIVDWHFHCFYMGIEQIREIQASKRKIRLTMEAFTLILLVTWAVLARF